MSLYRVVLNLARTDDFPEGNSDCGYNFIAPLDDEGHLDPKKFAQSGIACTVARFWQGQDSEFGELIQTDSGEWAFSYELGDDDDEPFVHLGQHVIREGEYVSLTEHDGVTRPFRIVAVRPLAAE